MAELRNWQPGWIDRARHTAQGMLAPLFGGDERAAMAYVDDKVKPTLEYMPGVGDAMAAAEARDEFAKGNYGMGGLLAAGAAVGLVPGVGDAVQKGVKKGINIVRKTPTMADAYIDDVFAGTVSLSENHPFVSAINVEPQYRGQGIGRELYAEAEKMAGKPLFPSPLGLTDDAVRMWKKRLASMPSDDAQRLLDAAQAAGEGYGILADLVAGRLKPLRESINTY